MSTLGGGGNKCTICDKTAYPAETITYEKKPYHVECFRCSVCSKKMENASAAAQFEDKLYCRQCFDKEGLAQKQKNVKWEKKESTGTAAPSKFGGGGTPCNICAKTVYTGEAVTFEVCAPLFSFAYRRRVHGSLAECSRQTRTRAHTQISCKTLTCKPPYTS